MFLLDARRIVSAAFGTEGRLRLAVCEDATTPAFAAIIAAHRDRFPNVTFALFEILDTEFVDRPHQRVQRLLGHLTGQICTIQIETRREHILLQQIGRILDPGRLLNWRAGQRPVAAVDYRSVCDCGEMGRWHGVTGRGNFGPEGGRFRHLPCKRLPLVPRFAHAKRFGAPGKIRTLYLFLRGNY